MFPDSEPEISIGKPEDVFLLKDPFKQITRRQGRDKSSNIPCFVFLVDGQHYLIQPNRYFGDHPHALHELNAEMISEMSLNDKKSKFLLLSCYIFIFVELINATLRPILRERAKREAAGMNISRVIFRFLYIFKSRAHI